MNSMFTTKIPRKKYNHPYLSIPNEIEEILEYDIKKV